MLNNKIIILLLIAGSVLFTLDVYNIINDDKVSDDKLKNTIISLYKFWQKQNITISEHFIASNLSLNDFISGEVLPDLTADIGEHEHKHASTNDVILDNPGVTIQEDNIFVAYANNEYVYYRMNENDNVVTVVSIISNNPDEVINDILITKDGVFMSCANNECFYYRKNDNYNVVTVISTMSYNPDEVLTEASIVEHDSSNDIFLDNPDEVITDVSIIESEIFMECINNECFYYRRNGNAITEVSIIPDTVLTDVLIVEHDSSDDIISSNPDASIVEHDSYYIISEHNNVVLTDESIVSNSAFKEVLTECSNNDCFYYYRNDNVWKFNLNDFYNQDRQPSPQEYDIWFEKTLNSDSLNSNFSMEVDALFKIFSHWDISDKITSKPKNLNDFKLKRTLLQLLAKVLPQFPYMYLSRSPGPKDKILMFMADEHEIHNIIQTISSSNICEK